VGGGGGGGVTTENPVKSWPYNPNCHSLQRPLRTSFMEVFSVHCFGSDDRPEGSDDCGFEIPQCTC